MVNIQDGHVNLPSSAKYTNRGSLLPFARLVSHSSWDPVPPDVYPGMGPQGSDLSKGQWTLPWGKLHCTTTDNTYLGQTWWKFISLVNKGIVKGLCITWHPYKASLLEKKTARLPSLTEELSLVLVQWPHNLSSKPVPFEGGVNKYSGIIGMNLGCTRQWRTYIS